MEEVLALLEEERAEEVVVLDVRKKCNWTSYFVIASGRTGRQVEGMAEFIVKRLKEKRQKLLYDMDDSSSDWIALDLGEIVVHLMVPAGASPLRVRVRVRVCARIYVRACRVPASACAS